MKSFSIYLIPGLFILNQNISFPQQYENWLERNDPIQYKKLYLHTDREFYFQGDTIWFKAYYLDGQTQLSIPGFISMYFDLMNKDGLMINSQILPIDNGVSKGKINIPPSLEPGNYVLRAFTDFHKNIGEDVFFHKTLKISKVKGSFELTVDSSTINSETKPEIDIAFLAEGGYLLAGQMNVVGIKAVDEYGSGVAVRGEILDSKGKIVKFFNTKYRGMNEINLTPQEGEIYKVRVENYTDYKYEFSDIIKDGIKLEFNGKSRDDLLFRVTTNSKLFQGKNYYFAIMHRGKVLFYQKFVQNNKDFGIKVNQSVLPAGINRFVILDEQLRPISERLLFSKNIEVNDVKITLNQNQYERRSNVQLELFDEMEIQDWSYSNLSVAVVDENAAGENGPSVNILTWLLIDSELKGYIESPADYFTDDKNISSEDKLNLLMLTQGWSRYLWNIIPGKTIHPDYKESEGISVKGSVQQILGKKPVVDGLVSLSIFKDDYFISARGMTDENGRFSFDSIYFNDTVSVFLQALNEKGKLSTEVFLDPIYEKSPGVSKLYLPVTQMFTDAPVELYKQQYLNERAWSEYLIKSGSIWIEEITVVGQKKEKPDEHFRIYGNPQNSFKIIDSDLAYRNVFEYLQGRVSGILVIGDKIMIHGIGSFGYYPPLFLLNGVEVDNKIITSIPMNDIDIVEVLIYPAETAIFGARGGNGVISIFTKEGGVGYSKINIPGTISKKIIGYSSYREFYSPAYTPENVNSEKPDHRITLYWNPDIITENGKASVSFFTSDDISHFKVFVEGMTDNGKICLGTSEFEVR